MKAYLGVLVCVLLAADAGRGETAAPALNWGETVGGLQCALSSDTISLPMGSWMKISLQFRFDGKTAEGKPDVLNVDTISRKMRFFFKRTDDGKVYERLPYDCGMFIPGDPGNMVEMRKGEIPAAGEQVPLLSEKGEQLPPGDYMVAVAYENQGSKVEYYAGDTALHNRDYARPERLWKGTVTSGPFKLQVTPASAKETTIEVATTLTFEPGGEKQVVCMWGKEDRRKVSVTVRPGYILGMSTKKYRSVAGAPEKQCGEETGGGGWCEGDVFWMSPLEATLILDGVAEVKARAVMTLFETSVPAGHWWTPERGDYKVLWTGEASGVRPAKPMPK